MIKIVRSTSRPFYLWNILTSLLILCLALSTSLSLAFGMPDDVTDEVAAEEPMPTEPQTDFNTPKEKTIDLGNGVKMQFVLIPAGEFDMGSPSTERDRDNDESPVHRVTISKLFYMGKYEVTQQQYYIVAKSKPSQFKQDDRPVETVSWEQAYSFCKKLSKIKGESFRLPTEAEWEYACRAGSQSRFYFGDDPTYVEIEQYAWCSKNSDSETHSVGQKKPNSFGLYDMHGNVWEWCSDYYAADYYHKSISVDPIGALYGKSRVIRGGDWSRSAIYCRSANRSSLEPYYIRNHIGFRIVLEVE
jgi:formylglycine-generating enzyme required for sulfatase activity